MDKQRLTSWELKRTLSKEIQKREGKGPKPPRKVSAVRTVYLPWFSFPSRRSLGRVKAGGAPENRYGVQEAPGEQTALQGLTFHCGVQHLLENWSISGSACDRVFLIYDLALFCSLA